MNGFSMGNQKVKREIKKKKFTRVLISRAFWRGKLFDFGKLENTSQIIF